MEIVKREKTDFRARQLRAQQMLRGDLEGDALEQHVRESIITTTLDKAVDWARGNSMFPATFGLACCAIEMMSIVAARVDVARFGFEAFRASAKGWLEQLCPEENMHLMSVKHVHDSQE